MHIWPASDAACRPSDAPAWYSLMASTASHTTPKPTPVDRAAPEIGGVPRASAGRLDDQQGRHGEDGELAMQERDREHGAEGERTLREDATATARR